jgi:hypothetical protein
MGQFQDENTRRAGNRVFFWQEKNWLGLLLSAREKDITRFIETKIYCLLVRKTMKERASIEILYYGCQIELIGRYNSKMCFVAQLIMLSVVLL